MSKKLKSPSPDLNTGEVVTTPVDVMNLPEYPWRTQFNYVQQPGQKFDPVNGRTTPGQSLSMVEIVRRYQEGRPLSLKSATYGGYDLDEPLPDLRKMDLSEIYQLKEENEKALADIRDEFKERNEKHKKLAQENAKEKWIQQELEKRDKEAARKKQGEEKDV